MQKRGQVTLFVILGVTVVVLAALVLYYRDYVSSSLSSIGIPVGMKVPGEFQEVGFYVEDCVHSISEDGIRLLGSQGGYISIPNDPLPAGPANPFSNRLLVFPNADLEVPYWFYFTANNIPKNVPPSVTFMEKSLASYIDSNLDSCISNFSDFSRFKISSSYHKTSVKINKDSVDIDLSYPINIKLGNNEYNFNEFKFSSDAALGKLYSMALQIHNSESNNYYLEDKTFDVLALYDEIPLSETDFSCSPKVWSKSKVASDLKRFLSYNIPPIKVKGAGTSVPTNKYFEWNSLESSYPSTNVNFVYSESWPFYFDVVPSEGDLLKGDSFIKRSGNKALSYISSLFCLNQYHFIYDIRHPVLVMLHDDNSFNGRGLDFQYATLVVIDNNQPRENKALDLDLPDDVTNEVCNYGSSKITVNVLKPSKDNALLPIPGADVSYKCITNLCGMGVTDREGSLTSNFPPCVNGFVIAGKEGFSEGKVSLSTNEPGSISVILEPYYVVDLDVKVLSPSVRTPLSTEKIIFSFVNTESDYSTSFTYPEDKNVTLVVGDYEVSSYVIEESPFDITIPGRDIEHCDKVPKGVLGIFGVEEERCFTVKTPPSTLKTLVKGGVNFNFTVSRSDLSSSSKLVVYTVADKSPSSYEDIANIYSTIDGNINKPYFIYPRFEK